MKELSEKTKREMAAGQAALARRFIRQQFDPEYRPDHIGDTGPEPSDAAKAYHALMHEKNPWKGL